MPIMGTYESSRPLQINDRTSKTASFTAPNVTQPETVHIVLDVTDNEIPVDADTQRVIVTVFPK